MHRLWHIDVIGASNIPSSGPVLVAPNHIAFIDSIFMTTLLEREALGLGKAEYMDSWKTRHILPGIGMIPLDRSGGEASERALDRARDALTAGKVFVIYPEGTRSRDGHLHRGHTGVARLALETGSPIVPVGICGTDKIRPADQRFPSTGVSVTIQFGEPITMDAFESSSSDHRRLLRDITDDVLLEIGKLCGQTYADWYHGQKPTSSPQQQLDDGSADESQSCGPG